MATSATKNMQKICTDFYCEKCDYKCSKKSLWIQHLSTYKHNRQQNLHISNIKYAQKNFKCDICNKIYLDRSGLWRHKKKCFLSEHLEENCILKSELEKENEKLKDLMKDMVKNVNEDAQMKQEMMQQLKEQSKIIHDMIPKLGNNNNNKFNINVFLNEQCKDAINMSDFIESLNVQLKDITYTKNNGLIEGISTVFLNGLKQLDTYQRPIHCTDIKREILYIKDNNTWEKEQSKEKIRNAINDVAYKQRKAIKEWENNNPDWAESDKGKEDYINLVKTVMQDIDENSNSENKIIKSIVKETIIDK